jgi:hypothetical protein
VPGQSCSSFVDLFAARLCLFKAQFQALFAAFASSVDLFFPIDLFVSAHKTSLLVAIKTGLFPAWPLHDARQATSYCLHLQKSKLITEKNCPFGAGLYAETGFESRACYRADLLKHVVADAGFIRGISRAGAPFALFLFSSSWKGVLRRGI